MNKISNPNHFSFFHSSCCKGWCTDTNPAGDQGACSIEWDHIFIDCNASFSKYILSYFPRDLFSFKIKENHMSVRTSGDERISMFRKSESECTCIFNDLITVFLVSRLKVLFKSNSLCCDNIHQRAPLYTGHHIAV